MDIRVQTEAFHIGTETQSFADRNKTSGAVCTFVGQMRDFKPNGEIVVAMHLDAYPGMAQKQLSDLANDAKARWPLDDIAIIHRYGTLSPGDAIVFVATASAHRGDAFASCEFLMDWLKTKAPFWKKETGPGGSSWVEAQASDDARADRWSISPRSGLPLGPQDTKRGNATDKES